MNTEKIKNREKEQELYLEQQRLNLWDKELQEWKVKEAELCKKEDELILWEQRLAAKEREIKRRERICNCEEYQNSRNRFWKIRRIKFPKTPPQDVPHS